VRNYRIMRSSITCTFRQILLGSSSHDDWMEGRGVCMGEIRYVETDAVKSAGMT
jgi:hypothetical protein